MEYKVFSCPDCAYVQITSAFKRVTCHRCKKSHSFNRVKVKYRTNDIYKARKMCANLNAMVKKHE